jgi:hypothetical protein
VISAIAKTHGLAQVLDVSSPVVLYTNGENDITDEVVKQLNANAPAAKTDDTEKKDEKKSEKKK